MHMCVCLSVCTLTIALLDRFLQKVAQRKQPPKVRTSSLGVNIAPPLSLFALLPKKCVCKLKSQKYLNLLIIESTVSIPTKFCTVIKTTKCLLRVVQTRASQIQDGGRPPSWKNRKIAISQQRFDGSPQNLAR